MSATTVIFLLGILLAAPALFFRRRAGIGYGYTISHDHITLTSTKLGLTGRPDRIIQRGKKFIPEEKKSSKRLRQSHVAQIGAYLLLCEEQYGVRPRYGFVVLGNGRRVKVKNTRKLRREVLEVADAIRYARKHSKEPLETTATARQCSFCGQKENCSINFAASVTGASQ